MCSFSLRKILGVSSLDDVLDQYHVNPRNIIHNMTKVNKHGVVTLEDKTGGLAQGKQLWANRQFATQHTVAVAQVVLLIMSPDDLPHWVLNAMKSLANCEYQEVDPPPLYLVHFGQHEIPSQLHHRRMSLKAAFNIKLSSDSAVTTSSFLRAKIRQRAPFLSRLREGRLQNGLGLLLQPPAAAAHLRAVRTVHQCAG